MTGANLNTNPRAIPARSSLVAICCASFALSLSVPILTRSPFGDLGSYTDHLRHTFSSWIFIHEGFEVYRTPSDNLALVFHTSTKPGTGPRSPISTHRGP